MRRYKPYLSYKPSGVEWLDEIPEHWNLTSVKHLAGNHISVVQTGPFGAQLHASDYVDEGIPVILIRNVNNFWIDDSDIPRITKEKAEKLPIYRLEVGDIIFSRVGTIGRIALVTEREKGWIISGQMLRVRIRNSILGDQFLLYYFSSKVVSDYINLKSIGSTRESINTDILRDCVVPVPPLEEQKLIATFLNRDITRIDTLITQKSDLIELLQKKRAAIITNAVTKGLDPQAPMKDSGLEWLDKVPAHWIVKRLKFTAQVQTGLTLGKDYTGRNVVTRPYLRVANVQDGFLDLQTITEISIPVEDIRRYELKPGDVLMTEGGDFDKLGRGYVWEGQIEGCLHQNHVFAVRPYPEYLNSHYLAALMTSHYGKAYFTSTSQQTTNLATTNRTKLSNFSFPLPNIIEQKEIVTYIHREVQKNSQVIYKLQQQIDALQKYRKAKNTYVALTATVPVSQNRKIETLTTTKICVSIGNYCWNLSLPASPILGKTWKNNTGKPPFDRNFSLD